MRRIAKQEAKVAAGFRQEIPDLSVLCGADSVRFGFEQDLLSRGLRVNPRARMKLLLDVPRAFAMRTLEELNGEGCKTVVVTWNSCPEYVEDLRELGPTALLSDEFFVKQNANNAFFEVLRLVCHGKRYEFVPGPNSVLIASERAVLRYAACGWDNRRISERLCVAEQTVKNRLRSVYSKLDICNRAQAALYYWQITQPFE